MDQPSPLLYAALVAYLPFVAACFQIWGGRRAVLISLLVGWLFLPWFNPIGRTIPFLHSKQMFVSVFVLGVSLLLDGQVWRGLRPRLVDLPVLVLCLGPFFTSLANGLGAYDGASAVFEASATWGAPYLLGRAYLGRPGAILDAARAVVLTALAYMPLCLWEIRMSPQLHRQLYGFHQHNIAQHFRDGHPRPMVFLAHGLMVGMLMASGAVTAWWLWRTRSLRDVAGIRLAMAAPALAIMTYLCRSTGALLIMVGGVLVLEASRHLRWPVLLLALALGPAGYVTLRIAGTSPAVMPLVEAAGKYFGPNRAESLRIRVVNDEMLTERALQRPWLGWGRWGDSRVQDEDGRDITVVDGLWVLQLGTTGLIGLCAAGLLLALPLLTLLKALPGRTWDHPQVAPAAVLAVVVGLWAVDDLLNAMMSPVYPMLAGAVVSFALLVLTRRRAPVGAMATSPPLPPARPTWA